MVPSLLGPVGDLWPVLAVSSALGRSFHARTSAQYTSQQPNVFVHPSLPVNNNIILHNSGRLSIHSFPFAGTLPTPPSPGPCAHSLAHSSYPWHMVLSFCSVVSLVAVGEAIFLFSLSHSLPVCGLPCCCIQNMFQLDTTWIDASYGPFGWLATRLHC